MYPSELKIEGPIAWENHSKIKFEDNGLETACFKFCRPAGGCNEFISYISESIVTHQATPQHRLLMFIEKHEFDSFGTLTASVNIVYSNSSYTLRCI